MQPDFSASTYPVPAPPTASEAAERDEARRVDCPVCVSREGEDCCPYSLTRPHRKRLLRARGELV
jgi:hypothetical protein